MIVRNIAAVGLIALTVSACQTAGPGESIGTVGGAVAGGLIGSTIGAGSGNVAATIAGAAIGGLIGNQIGRALDDDARRRAYEAEYQALEYGTDGAPVAWRDEGHYGTVVPGPIYSSGRYQRCREFTHTIYIDGRPETARGVACRQPDGTWSPIA